MGIFSDNEEQIKQGFIIEVRDKMVDSIADIPKNRTLLIADLTDKPATSPEIVYGLKNELEVFKHFKPSCEIEFENEEGVTKKETLEFKNLADFGPQGITDQSEILKSLENKVEDFQGFARKLRSNKPLQQLLANPETKKAYLAVLKELITELEALEN